MKFKQYNNNVITHVEQLLKMSDQELLNLKQKVFNRSKNKVKRLLQSLRFPKINGGV